MRGPENTSEAANLYWDIAARLAVVYADQRPLDITAQEDTHRDGRVSVSLAPRAKDEIRPHIALTTERLDRIGGVLGRVVIDAATVTTITLEGDTVGGAQQAWQRNRDKAGELTAEGTAFDAKALEPAEAIGELEAIAEHVLNMTADVTQPAIDDARYALQELAKLPQTPSQLPASSQNPSV
jgi:hypothetical protein